MQTFLPSIDFVQSAKWLDNARLGKQRVECYQILRAITDSSYGWQNHPAVNMWRGYETALIAYGIQICLEWIKRGYKDECKDKIYSFFEFQEIIRPPWLTEEFASNHRSILLGKALEKYSENKAYQVNLFYDDKQYKKANRKTKKSLELFYWYKSHGWTEQPAQRNEENKWPYLWPIKETI